ncbi:ATP-binding protein [Streptomyces sp. 4N509B]|uniref:ATP-binding protein n=1 Tax=Streptomyces sp. 4N509B TaxID=3457413 RepID=UPI003FCF4B13
MHSVPSHRLRLPVRDTSASAARRCVREVLDAWRLPYLADDASLIVSELVTNVVQHTPFGIAEFVELTLERHDATLLIAVADSWPWEIPVADAPDPHAQNGRGLLLVDALARSWGVEAHHGRKTVWARLGLTTACTNGPGSNPSS